MSVKGSIDGTFALDRPEDETFTMSLFVCCVRWRRRRENVVRGQADVLPQRLGGTWRLRLASSLHRHWLGRAFFCQVRH